MAARNPSSFVEWIEERNLLEGSKLTSTDPNATFNDQVMVLDSERQTVNDAFLPVRVTATSYQEIARYHVRGKDGCSSSSNDTSHKVIARVWVDNGHTITVRVDSTVASDSTFATYTNGTGAALELDLNVGTLDVRDNTEETLTVQMRTTSGGDPEIFGILIYGVQT